MTKLVTKAKFSLLKAEAEKCRKESGQASGQVKLNLGESKLIWNPASDIQVNHLETEEAKLGRLGGGVQGR